METERVCAAVAWRWSAAYDCLRPGNDFRWGRDERREKGRHTQLYKTGAKLPYGFRVGRQVKTEPSIDLELDESGREYECRRIECGAHVGRWGGVGEYLGDDAFAAHHRAIRIDRFRRDYGRSNDRYVQLSALLCAVT